jgi:hypothetical protein
MSRRSPPTSEHDQGRKPRGNRPQIEARVGEILRIRLDGAELWDCREYVSQKEKEDGSVWKLPDGLKPLSRRQVERYVRQADKLISQSCKRSRAALIRHHRAKVRNLYAKSVNAAEFTAALRCLQEEAKMLDLYPKALPPLEVLLAAVAALNPGLAGAIRPLLAPPLPAGGPAPGGEPGPGGGPVTLRE